MYNQENKLTKLGQKCNCDCRVFACDVMAAMLVYLDKRILNIFFGKYTNMAANFFVVLILGDWVKTLYCVLKK